MLNADHLTPNTKVFDFKVWQFDAKLYLVILTYKPSKLIILNFFLWTNLFLNFLKKELESKIFCTKGLTPNDLYLESKDLHLTLNDLYFRINRFGLKVKSFVFIAWNLSWMAFHKFGGLGQSILPQFGTGANSKLGHNM